MTGAAAKAKAHSSRSIRPICFKTGNMGVSLDSNAFGQSIFAYGELERSTGGDVENPWGFNVGVRHLF